MASAIIFDFDGVIADSEVLSNTVVCTENLNPDVVVMKSAKQCV